MLRETWSVEKNKFAGFFRSKPPADAIATQA